MRSELVGDLLTADARAVMQVLRAARDQLRGGYSCDWCHRDGYLPPHTKLSELRPHELAHSLMGGVLRAHPVGPICEFDDEGVRFFDVRGALQAAAGGDLDAQMVAEDLLRWLNGREIYDARLPLPEVLALFDRAVLRAQAVSRRKD